MADALTASDFAALDDLIQWGDAIGYYAYRAEKGYDYGHLAAGLADNDTFNGQAARAFAASVAEEEDITLTDADWGIIQQQLMRADFEQRQKIFIEAGGQAVDVTLSVRTIRDYHKQI